MAIHELKTWHEPFQAVWNGAKNFEVRKFDRPFGVGDTVMLREYDPEIDRYSGRVAKRVITYLVPGGAWGLPKDLCVFGWEYSEGYNNLTTVFDPTTKEIMRLAERSTAFDFLKNEPDRYSVSDLKATY